MKGKERGRKERKRQKERETLSGVAEKEGGLRGTALSVQFKNKTKKKTKKLDELNDVSNV